MIWSIKQKTVFAQYSDKRNSLMKYTVNVDKCTVKLIQDISTIIHQRFFYQGKDEVILLNLSHITLRSVITFPRRQIYKENTKHM